MITKPFSPFFGVKPFVIMEMSVATRTVKP
jgi:hypothetical protein